VHEDQFTATGPPLSGSGVPFSAFSTKATGMVYGANVAGDRAGVVGRCGSEAGVDADVEGVGAYGSGNTIGVFGKTVSGGIARIAGVYGQDNQGKTGVLGAVMRGGTAVAGINNSSLGNPLATFDVLPNPGSGTGTGVYGTSGSGTGVLGTSNTGLGVHGTSNSSTAVFGHSQGGIGSHGASDRSTGVFGTSQSGFGVHGNSNSGPGGVFESAANAQLRLLPRDLATPEGQVAGAGGELLATVAGGECRLWFCTRAGDPTSASWDLVAGTRPFAGASIAENATGIDVKRIQMRLNLIFGTDLNGDGEFGPITKEAVSAFQEREEIVKNGIVDAQTWDRLFALT
jgi:hypothetical protein